MKKLLKIVAVVLAILFALPLGLLALLLFANWQDEPLDPAAAVLLAAAPEQIPVERNGYFPWIGVLGPAAQPPGAWGYRWYQAALQADKSALAKQAPLPISREIRQESLRASDIPCRDTAACLGAVSARPEAARAVLARGYLTLERGDMARAAPDFQEAWRPDFSLASPMPAHAHRYRDLSATRFALAVAEGSHEAALEQLLQNVAFHVRQAQGAQTLIEKMLALVSLQGDYLLVNQFILREPAAARLHIERLEALLTPLPERAVRLNSVLQTEFRGTARLYLALARQEVLSADRGLLGAARLSPWMMHWLGSRLYLPHASINAHFVLFRQLLAADDLMAEDYRRALAEAGQAREAATKSAYALRNPIGHVLMRAAVTDYGSFFLRRDDVLSLRAMVAFQLERLRHNEGDAEAIARAVATAGLAHPYTGTAPRWDAATRFLIHTAHPARRGNDALAIRL